MIFIESSMPLMPNAISRALFGYWDMNYSIVFILIVTNIVPPLKVLTSVVIIQSQSTNRM